jgi:hypoxanthine phosphoribosyltransferase
MEIMITEEQIQLRVKQLANEIYNTHTAAFANEIPVFICVLNGSFMFFTDLVRNMKLDMQIDFVRPKSYTSNENAGDVIFTKDVEIDLKGRVVYIIEDVIDSGHTMAEVLHRVHDHMPKQVNIITLIKRQNSDFPVNAYAFELDNSWIVGYGLDDNGIRRNINYIYKIK